MTRKQWSHGYHAGLKEASDDVRQAFHDGVSMCSYDLGHTFLALTRAVRHAAKEHEGVDLWVLLNVMQATAERATNGEEFKFTEELPETCGEHNDTSK